MNLERTGKILSPLVALLQVALLVILIVMVTDFNKNIERINKRLSAIAAIPQGPGRVELEADQQAPSMGNSDAKVKMVVFSDFECGYCKTFAKETLPLLKKDYIDKGLLQVSFRDLPLEMHDKAFLAAEAGSCANEQGKFWALHDSFFDNQSVLTRDFFMETARKEGLDLTSFGACLDSRKYKPAVEKDIRDANGVGITGTPAIIINGQVILGSRPYKEFAGMIEAALHNKDLAHVH